MTPSVKDEARAAMKARRATLTADERAAGSRALATHDLTAALPATPAIVSGFLPIRDEIDPRPLMAVLAQWDLQLCLPVMEGRTNPLRFRLYAPGDHLATVAWGIQEPTPDKPAVDPDVVLVPLLAFDARGNRLGYGAGHYDRSIAGLKRRKAIVTIGLAFDIQRIDAVPVNEYDEPLDWVLTPSGLLRCRA